jgi:hypothetical protein
MVRFKRVDSKMVFSEDFGPCESKQNAWVEMGFIKS